LTIFICYVDHFSLLAVADASAYICDSGTKKTDVQIAEETAEAFAVAVASASAQCDLQGTTNAYVNAHAQAKAAAEVFVQAYAAAWASAGDCEKCGAFVGSFGYVEKYVFLEAVASTGFNVCPPLTPHLPPYRSLLLSSAFPMQACSL
jgi:hypothetical protein